MNRFLFLIACFFAIGAFAGCHTSQNTTTTTATVPTTVRPSSPSFETLTYNNFDALMKESKGLQMAYFWATWCGPCRAIAPALDNISMDFAGDLVIGKVNVDEQRVLADSHKVSTIPTFLFFKNGKLVFETSGLVTEQYLVNVIERLL